MKTKNVLALTEKAKELVLISKERKLIKPHTEAFKDFPVEEEANKGKLKNNKESK